MVASSLLPLVLVLLLSPSVLGLDNVGTVHHAECLYDKGNRADHAARSALTCSHWVDEGGSDCFSMEVDDIVFDTRNCCVLSHLPKAVYKMCSAHARKEQVLPKECLDETCLEHVGRALALVHEAQPQFTECTQVKREGGVGAPVPVPCKSASDKLAAAA